MKIFWFLIASTLIAQCPPIDTCVPQTCAYLPANPLPGRGYGWIDFLYWEGIERGLEYAMQNQGTALDQNLHLHEPEFGFHPAFRLGAGYHLSHDSWDLEAFWTRYTHHTSNQTSQSIFSIWTCASAFQNNAFLSLWGNASAKWHLHANCIDLALKNRLFMTPALSLEPSFGLKLALLQQRYAVQYANGNTSLTSSLQSIHFI
ncbi:MAG: hypothetical protein KGI83_06945, partial [Verrucomicrobiota bacterium]|nr:hypothetical protein [Verrucomicrobiota bacterium]